jgi:threonine synthase
VRAGTIGKSERVVCISTAHGLKFTEFKVRYHESQLEGLRSNAANPAVLLPPDYDAVMAAIQKKFADAS